MRSYNERTEYIINEINRRKEAKRKKRAVFKNCAVIAACLSFAAILTIQLRAINKTPVINTDVSGMRELPDPYSVNDISAYVSEIMTVTSSGSLYTYNGNYYIKENFPRNTVSASEKTETSHSETSEKISSE